jgi:hypothetical protein
MAEAPPPFQMHVLCIVGNKGTGKTTIRDFAIEFINRTLGAENVFIETASFADPLKRAACALFDLSWHQVTDPVAKETIDCRWDLKPRTILHKLGTDCIQKRFGWIGVLTERMKTHLAALHQIYSAGGMRKPLVVVIDDVRFVDEVGAVSDWNARFIRVQRMGCAPDKHESEQTDRLVLPCNHAVLFNDGTRDALKLNTQRAVRFALGDLFAVPL